METYLLLPDLSALSPSQRKLSRLEFEQACKPMLDVIFGTVQRTLNDMRVDSSAKEIEVIIIVGAASYMPMIQTRMQRMFPGKTINRQLDVSHAVATGTAIRAEKQLK